MTNSLVEVGISLVNEKVRKRGPDEVAKELVIRALRSVDTNNFPVRCALLLASVDWCWFPTSVSQLIRSELREKLGYDVPLIGSSMAGFYCSLEPESYVQNGLLLIAICSNDLNVTVTSVPKPHLDGEDERKAKLNEMARELERDAGIKLGASADRSLFGFLPGIISDEQGRHSYFDNELYHEILAAFSHKYPLVGASSADRPDPTVGFQFANNECLESGIAIALVETHLNTAAMMSHGFTPFSGIHVSVDSLEGKDSEGYRIVQLDGQSAVRRLQELRKTNPFPLGKPVFGVPYGSDFDVIWPTDVNGQQEDSIRLKRRVSVGDQLYLLEGTPEHLLEASEKALRGLLERTGMKVSDLSLILGFSCVGRLRFYNKQGANWKGVIQQLRGDYLGVPLVWALSAGEFGLDEFRRPRANNMSVTVMCMTNVYSRRAVTKILHRRLLRSASHFAKPVSPNTVMETALVGAIDAGATGGQICLVDPKLGRILGKGFGYATQARGFPHNWPVVAQMTNREAPHSLGGEFPLQLRDYAMPVMPDLPLRISFVEEPLEGEKEDILTLAARTLQAVFIPDSTNPRFHCDLEAVDAGKFHCQLVIPLIGSQGKAIATLQLSFADDEYIDRERFSLWIGYSQKIAAALERTQEVEERRIIEQISRLGDTIMHTPIDPKLSPYEWCKGYLNLVIRLLGIDGGHIRLLQKVKGYEYRLIDSVGCLSDLLPATRPIIYEGDGSYNRQLLESGGKITNTQDETAWVNRGVKAVENEEQYGAALKRRLDEIQSLAMLPLYNQGQVLGAFLLYSKNPYMFTERRERIARTAATMAGAILRAKRSDYDRAQLDVERTQLDIERGRLDAERSWMLESLTSLKGETAEERLHALVEHVCKMTMADAGSLFVWYGDPDKLILRDCYNWDHPLISKASYELGEGWTGNIPFKKEDVTIITPKSADAKLCKKKFDEHIIPPEHRLNLQNDYDARIGIKLTAGGQMIGVLVLIYYMGSAARAAAEDIHVVNFLTFVTRFITLCVETAKLETSQARIRHLLDAKSLVASKLIRVTSDGQGWQPVADELRRVFNVERVSFYSMLPDKKLELAWFSSSLDGWTPTVGIGGRLEPFKALGDVALRGAKILIKSPEDPRLELWPNSKGVRTLFAMPVADLQGNTRGIIEYVNRFETHDHPFNYLDVSERSVAEDINRPLVAAIEHLESERAFSELLDKLATATKIGASGLFSNTVMHQIMRPFSNIRGSIDWLRLHPDCDDQDRVRHLDRIGAYYDQAIRTIKEAAQQGMPIVRLEDLRNLVAQAHRAIRPEIMNSRIKFTLINDMRVQIRVDPWSIVTALVNVLSNALEALESERDNHESALSISTEVESDNKMAIVRIHNSGPPLSKEEIARLFDPGYSTKKTDTSEYHIGFGLPLAKQAIENAKGTLCMSSPTSGGVEVIISLPIATNLE